MKKAAVIKFEISTFKEASLIGFTELQSAQILEGFAKEYLRPHETINIESMKEGTTTIPTFVARHVFDINGSSYTSPNLEHYNDKWQAEISNILCSCGSGHNNMEVILCRFVL